MHLTTFRELERHCRNEEKHAGYGRLLADFGVGAASFAPLVAHPRLVLAEQPGSWFCCDDLLRYRLLVKLIEAYDFHESSGVLFLTKDAFSVRGLKKYFLLLHLHSQVEPVQLVGAAFIRRHRNRVYSALPISGSTCERMATILDYSLAMFAAAETSADAFAEEVLAIFRGGVRPGARPLLPRSTDRRSLRELGARIADYDLSAAAGTLLTARHELCDGISWVDYWNRVNGSFLGARIGRLDPLFNRFLLAVEDPVRMSRTLMRLCRLPESEPVAVAAFITRHEKYRMVFFDPLEEDFFYVPKAGERREISWRRIRALAEQGQTGGPSGTLEYLLMAASGIYLVADPEDGYNRFEGAARRIHEHYTGLPFPYVAFPDRGRKRTFDYLPIYGSAFERRSRNALERFFE